LEYYNFYDLGFLLKKYLQELSKDSLRVIYDKVSYLGLKKLNLFLRKEVQKYKLVSQDKINITDNYSEYIFKQLGSLLTKYS